MSPPTALEDLSAAVVAGGGRIPTQQAPQTWSTEGLQSMVRGDEVDRKTANKNQPQQRTDVAA